MTFRILWCDISGIHPLKIYIYIEVIFFPNVYTSMLKTGHIQADLE